MAQGLNPLNIIDIISMITYFGSFDHNNYLSLNFENDFFLQIKIIIIFENHFQFFCQKIE